MTLYLLKYPKLYLFNYISLTTRAIEIGQFPFVRIIPH